MDNNIRFLPKPVSDFHGGITFPGLVNIQAFPHLASSCISTDEARQQGMLNDNNKTQHQVVVLINIERELRYNIEKWKEDPVFIRTALERLRAIVDEALLKES